MSFIHYAAKEIHCKIVYYGPGLSGKTTNIQAIFQKTQENARGQWVTLSTENERTLFFDFLPLAIGAVGGFQVRFHLYSIPGQTFYDISRQFLLKGVDGIVFVADSQQERMEANIESLESLEKSLQLQGYELKRLPFVLQYNKRDLPDRVSLYDLQSTLNSGAFPYFEAIASQGQGVMETLNFIGQEIIQELKGRREAEPSMVPTANETRPF